MVDGTPNVRYLCGEEGPARFCWKPGIDIADVLADGSVALCQGEGYRDDGAAECAAVS